MNFHLKPLLATFAAVMLAASAGSAHAAFMITQATGGNYVPVAGPVACGAGKCTTRLKPATVVDLGQMNDTNTATLAADLLDQKPPDYSVSGFGSPLDINFVVTRYEAVNDGSTGGGILVIDFVGNTGFTAPDGLHWVQIVNDNWNITGVNGSDTSAPTGPGKPENVVDAPGVTSPYYDEASAAASTPFNTNPPHFEDYSRRGEPTAANPVVTWAATLFLVSDDGEHNLTVYDGVQWGWETIYQAVPEPATWMVMLMGFGVAGLVLRRKAALPAA